MKTVKKLGLAAVAAAALMLAGCADGPYNGYGYYGPGSNYDYAYAGPYYPWGGGVYISNYHHGGYYGHGGYAHAGGWGHGGGGWHRGGGGWHGGARAGGYRH